MSGSPSTKRYLVRHANGSTSGPVDKEALKRLVAQGVVNPEDDLCVEGDSRWVAAWKAKGLFPEERLTGYGKPSAATAPASVASSGAISGDEGLTQELRKLASLRKEDLISEAEYVQKKAILLGLPLSSLEHGTGNTQDLGSTPIMALPFVEAEDSGPIPLAVPDPSRARPAARTHSADLSTAGFRNHRPSKQSQSPSSGGVNWQRAVVLGITASFVLVCGGVGINFLLTADDRSSANRSQSQSTAASQSASASQIPSVLLGCEPVAREYGQAVATRLAPVSGVMPTVEVSWHLGTALLFQHPSESVPTDWFDEPPGSRVTLRIVVTWSPSVAIAGGTKSFKWCGDIVFDNLPALGRWTIGTTRNLGHAPTSSYSPLHLLENEIATIDKYGKASGADAARLDALKQYIQRFKSVDATLPPIVHLFGDDIDRDMKALNQKQVDLSSGGTISDRDLINSIVQERAQQRQDQFWLQWRPRFEAAMEGRAPAPLSGPQPASKPSSPSPTHATVPPMATSVTLDEWGEELRRTAMSLSDEDFKNVCQAANALAYVKSARGTTDWTREAETAAKEVWTSFGKLFRVYGFKGESRDLTPANMDQFMEAVAQEKRRRGVP